MASDSSYWAARAVRRRSMLRGAALAGAGAAAAALAGCAGNSSPKAQTGNAPAASATTASATTPSVAASAAAARSGAARTASPAAGVDSTKGKPGGTFSIQANIFPPNLELVGIATSNNRIAGVSHSGLLQYKAGRSGIDAGSVEVEPDAAQAMPEQPDQLTQVYKLRPGIKFHNGRAMTSDDVKYSLNRYASWDKSVWRDYYTFVDSIDTPDPQTVTVKSKSPFADAIQTMAVYQHPYILAKEAEEGPDVASTLMGSGPYMFVSSQSPVTMTFKKNPNYYQTPYPYFDQINFNFVTDAAKQVADVISRQINFSWFSTRELTDQIKPARPDMQTFVYQGFGQAIFPRVDKPPFNDKRVRQAMSMAVDRKLARDTVFKGEGEDDQTLSISNTAWGFRKPSQLKSAKNWTYDPQGAKQLLAAAGFDKPIEAPYQYPTGSASQFLIDLSTVIMASWKQNGIVNAKDTPQPQPIFLSTVNVGQFDGIGFFQNTQYPLLGSFWRGRLFSPPEGVQAPTNNIGHIYDPDLNVLVDKQLTQFNVNDRKTTFHDIEEILGDQQYRIIMSTYNQTWFMDAIVKDAVAPLYAYQGECGYLKWWWFDK